MNSYADPLRESSPEANSQSATSKPNHQSVKATAVADVIIHYDATAYTHIHSSSLLKTPYSMLAEQPRNRNGFKNVVKPHKKTFYILSHGICLELVRGPPSETFPWTRDHGTLYLKDFILVLSRLVMAEPRLRRFTWRSGREGQTCAQRDSSRCSWAPCDGRLMY